MSEVLMGLAYYYRSLRTRCSAARKRFQKPVYYTLNTSIFSDPLISSLNAAQARGHVALPTHGDWTILSVSLVLSILQWFATYDLRID